MKLSLEELWKIIIWTSIVLGFATLVPWKASIPNHLGYYSICSSAPLSTIMMFVLAATFYFYWKKDLWSVYGAIIILLMISGTFGYWVLVYKLPLNSLNVKITVTYVWSGYDEHLYEGNISRMSFNITFSNPTDSELSFRIESYAFYINNTKLRLHTYDYGYYWSKPYTLQAYQEISIDSHLTISQRSTRTVKGKFENFWLSLMQQPFTLSMSGTLSNRYYYGPTIEYTFVVAARTFTTTYTYSP